MAELTVPTPLLDFAGPAPGVAVLEKKIQVCGFPVTFPDGREFTSEHLGQAGYFVYRRAANGSLPDVWHEKERVWKPESAVSVSDLQPQPLLFQKDNVPRWSSPLVAAGRKDQNAADQFRKASGLFPQYFVRASFVAKANGTVLSGLSAPSAAVRFFNLADSMLAGLSPGEDETPENATRIKLFLRNPSLQLIGIMEIRRDAAGGAEIEISNHTAAFGSGAVIRLRASGDVEVEPSTGGKVRLLGPVLYQPADAAGNPIGPQKFLS